MKDSLIRKEDALDALTTYIYNVYKVVVGKTLPAEDCGDAAESVIDELPTANDKLIQIIEEGIKATGTADEYSVGMCNGMKWCKSLLDGKAPEYDIVQPKHKKRRR